MSGARSSRQRRRRDARDVAVVARRRGWPSEACRTRKSAQVVATSAQPSMGWRRRPACGAALQCHAGVEATGLHQYILEGAVVSAVWQRDTDAPTTTSTIGVQVPHGQQHGGLYLVVDYDAIEYLAVGHQGAHVGVFCHLQGRHFFVCVGQCFRSGNGGLFAAVAAVSAAGAAVIAVCSAVPSAYTPRPSPC